MTTQVLDHGEVELISAQASDESVLRAMLISTGRDDEAEHFEIWPEEDLTRFSNANPNMLAEVNKNRGRIKYLMREHHGTPFEHNFFTFRVKAPIFVFREWHRHRIGWSYNEQSGRYMELPEEWYIPDIANVRKRVGKPGHYQYEPVDENLGQTFTNQLDTACSDSYRDYKWSLDYGIAPEQARLFLHVNHYSSMYASCNARSLMNFLELRNAANAQQEIREYAKVLENIFAEIMPVTYEAFLEFGRRAP